MTINALFSGVTQVMLKKILTEQTEKFEREFLAMKQGYDELDQQSLLIRMELARLEQEAMELRGLNQQLKGNGPHQETKQYQPRVRTPVTVSARKKDKRLQVLRRLQDRFEQEVEKAQSATQDVAKALSAVQHDGKQCSLKEGIQELLESVKDQITPRDSQDWNEHQNADEVMGVIRKLATKTPRVCEMCGKTAAQLGVRRLQTCSACTIAPTYCGAECQRACWGAHKAECRAHRSEVD
jgi:hypothetical protein